MGERLIRLEWDWTVDEFERLLHIPSVHLQSPDVYDLID